MNTSVLIIGQGLCGSWLSYFLQQAGISFLVIDEDNPQSSSKIASGIINPITGRRHVKTWMIDDVMPFAVKAYKDFDEVTIQQKNILDFFPSLQMQQSFEERINIIDEGLLTFNANDWSRYFAYECKVGEINPCWLVDVNRFIEKQKEKLLVSGNLLIDQFDIEQLVLTEEGAFYKGIKAAHIIFCDGVSSVSNPYFTYLPFAPNKGEALIIECSDLPAAYMYKSGKVIVPWKHGLFWVGSSFEWGFTDALPSEIFRKETCAWLDNFLKLPYKVVSHCSGVRPANTERRPFAGFHPKHKAVGILNGMGTKGVSLAPYFAKQLAEHLVSGKKINPEADINRFEM